jgi:hypothetical protein
MTREHPKEHRRGTVHGLVLRSGISGAVAAAMFVGVGLAMSLQARGASDLVAQRAHAAGAVTATASSPSSASASSTVVPAAPVPPPSPDPAPRVDPAGTVWLCRPGIPDNPCAQSLDATSVSATGARVVHTASPAANPGFDCFYVYPTVSTQGTVNADLSVDPAETEVATRQVALFSQVCNVWSPIYRQPTMAAFTPGSSDVAGGALDVAYNSLLSGWRDYLTHYNNGRPVILIGHSTGTTMLVSLLEHEFDQNASLRKQLVSAILVGGYPQVAPGSDVGGSFRNIPACRSASQTGCVIGFNSYYGVPPPDSQFGRPGSSALCTNPAALAGGPGALDPYFVARGNSPAGQAITTPYVEYPGLYSASCESAGGATWLDVTAVSTPGDPRPRLTERLGPTWGLHADEVSLTLGNLISDVVAEEAAYR